MTPEHDPRIMLLAYRGENRELTSQVRFDGILTCLDDGHKRPIRLVNNMIDDTAPTMPISESTSLDPQVPEGLVQGCPRGRESTLFPVLQVQCDHVPSGISTGYRSIPRCSAKTDPRFLC